MPWRQMAHMQLISVKPKWGNHETGNAKMRFVLMAYLSATISPPFIEFSLGFLIFSFFWVKEPQMMEQLGAWTADGTRTASARGEDEGRVAGGNGGEGGGRKAQLLYKLPLGLESVCWNGWTSKSTCLPAPAQLFPYAPPRQGGGKGVAAAAAAGGEAAAAWDGVWPEAAFVTLS